MTVSIGSWEFEGPFGNLDELRDEPGLVAILTGRNDEYELIEMEESESVKTFIDSHGKYNFRGENSDEDLAVAVYYCSDLTASLRIGLIEEVMKELDEGDCDREDEPPAHLDPAAQSSRLHSLTGSRSAGVHSDFADVVNS